MFGIVLQVGSYFQIRCTAGWSCGGSAVLDELNAIVKLDSVDHLCKVPEAA